MGAAPSFFINQTEADMNYIDLHCDTLMAFAQEGGSQGEGGGVHGQGQEAAEPRGRRAGEAG